MSISTSQFSERRRRWYELIDSDVLTLIRNGRYAAARQQIQAITGIDPLPKDLYHID